MRIDAAMRMLLLTADPSLVTIFAGISNELGIAAESSCDSQQVSQQLNYEKYEALVLDFDTVSDAGPVLASVRQSRSNKNAVVFAVATDTKQMEKALQDRAHFLLRRPIETSAIRETLNVAFDLMLGERRRHFRCTAELPVQLTIINSGNSVKCSTINVSSNGISVATPVALKPPETVDIALVLPGGFAVLATGIVIWDDKQGKSGLRFQCRSPEMRHELDSWLDSKFAKQTMLHPGIRWNRIAKEWFCVRCFRTSDHLAKADAQRELSQFDCIVCS